MISPELQQLIERVTAKRPRTVLNHILQHGHITTDELKQLYGYNHPPRAARDVRERGIPLETFYVRGPDGRRIAAYRLGSGTAVEARKAIGRRPFSKALKQALFERDGERCAVCGAKFPARLLQIDHKVPYEVAGDVEGENDPAKFMLVCGSCNRAKSWSCEACPNWQIHKVVDVCETCMWGSPHNYTHIAMEQRRSLTIVWYGSETQAYERLKGEAAASGKDISEFTKDLLRESS